MTPLFIWQERKQKGRKKKKKKKTLQVYPSLIKNVGKKVLKISNSNFSQMAYMHIRIFFLFSFFENLGKLLSAYRLHRSGASSSHTNGAAPHEFNVLWVPTIIWEEEWPNCYTPKVLNNYLSYHGILKWLKKF